MAYTRSAVDPREFSSTQASTRSAKPGLEPGLWQRFLAAMMASRQRAAEREIALYLHDIGGKFTDDAEREIERRFLSTPARW
jgi:hypothetical protein